MTTRSHLKPHLAIVAGALSWLAFAAPARAGLISAFTPAAAGVNGIGDRMTMLVIQLAVILCAAKIAGFACERWLRIPDVLGELGIGIVIGPYALGGWLNLFPSPAANGFPISPELYGIATVASIVLLYLAGLETDLSMFLRYSLASILVGVGGVVVSFVFGLLGAVWFGLADSFGSPSALFLGVISTATSVGITVRVLSRRHRLHSPEGVTILGAAVIDDIIGIVLLAIVIGMSRLADGGDSVNWWRVLAIAGKAFGFWLVCTGLGLLLARRIGKFLEFFGSRETMATLSLGFALFLAGVSEQAGLALIIGAYVMGLSLSKVDCADELRRRLEPVYHTFVGVFFCVLGMMVNLGELRSVLIPGLLFSLFALFSKLFGCTLPSLLAGFNWRGALRIGSGMLPRGEVTLIMAGVGLSMSLISQDIFGVAVMMTLLCTIIAPVMMTRLFTDASGLRRQPRPEKALEPLSLQLPNKEVAEFLMSQILEMFEQEECYVHQLATGEPIFQVRKDRIAITVKREDDRLLLVSSEQDREYARLMMIEALAGLSRIFDGLRQMDKPGLLRKQLGGWTV